MLDVILQMRERLTSASGAAVLDTWASAWGQTRPVVQVGLHRPEQTGDWPLIGLLPRAETLDLMTGDVTDGQILLGTGVMLGDVVDGVAQGVLAVQALMSAVLEPLREPVRYSAQGCPVVLTRASLVEIVTDHPNYELAMALDLSRLGG